jgi:hypothetical protein
MGSLVEEGENFIKAWREFLDAVVTELRIKQLVEWILRKLERVLPH